MSAVATTFDLRSAAEAAKGWPDQGAWTFEDYRRLPDDGWRYEVICGRLFMSPAPRPRHQYSVGELYLAFRRFIDARQFGRLLLAPIDVKLPELAQPVQPDLVLIASEHLDIVTDDCVDGVPDLVVEVLSPSNWMVDRREKYEVYGEAGVREYWIVDPDRRTIEVFVLEGGSYSLFDRRGAGETIRSRLLAGFEVAIDDVLL